MDPTTTVTYADIFAANIQEINTLNSRLSSFFTSARVQLVKVDVVLSQPLDATTPRLLGIESHFMDAISNSRSSAGAYANVLRGLVEQASLISDKDITDDDRLEIIKGCTGILSNSGKLLESCKGMPEEVKLLSDQVQELLKFAEQVLSDQQQAFSGPGLGELKAANNDMTKAIAGLSTEMSGISDSFTNSSDVWTTLIDHSEGLANYISSNSGATDTTLLSPIQSEAQIYQKISRSLLIYSQAKL
ncbi:hypothetical protein BKA70DRAFT_1286555 [Coprinopsis sp. MPI-PUGE-AT-0042]|nr:hypothetical protein BKA70DRAFT_1286555 [Coprinopsis sp. MPI-PUGE-AT-0042]